MIYLTDRSFSRLNQWIRENTPSKILILVDENTHEHCLPLFIPELETTFPFEIIEIEAGEELKNIETATQLWEIFAEYEADRNALLINLGGGVVTDLGGFVASTYKRGIPFINVPTSLLAMCDAAIGGKTGIDLQSLKNIVGTFAKAELTLVFPDFLKTLPFVELRSGFAEMLKHGLIADSNHWKDLSEIRRITPESIAPLIATSMRIKEEIVAKDFKEKNLRKTLNFGHTFGHAVESLYLENGKTIPHGEAVAMGMIMETYLSNLENLLADDLAQKIIWKLSRTFPHVTINDFSDEEILRKMQNDKKNQGNSIRFSLLTNIGEANFDFEATAANLSRTLFYYRTLGLI